MKTPESGKDTNVLRKTPEEIKKGLDCCQTIVRCSICPYHDIGNIVAECTAQLSGDALAYIQQLESYLDEEGEQCGLLQVEVSSLQSRLAQAERERDAAVRDLQKISFCEDCKHLGKSKKQNPCRECQENYKEKPNWQWRGVCPENTKEQKA